MIPLVGTARDVLRECMKRRFINASIGAATRPPSSDMGDVAEDTHCLFQRLKYRGSILLKSLLQTRLLKDGSNFLSMRESDTRDMLTACESPSLLAELFDRLDMIRLVEDDDMRKPANKAPVMLSMIGELSIIVEGYKGNLIPLPEQPMMMRTDGPRLTSSVETPQLALSVIVDLCYTQGRTQFEQKQVRLRGFVAGPPLVAPAEVAPPTTAAEALVNVSVLCAARGRVSVADAEAELAGGATFAQVEATYPTLVARDGADVHLSAVARWLGGILKDNKTLDPDSLLPAQIQVLRKLTDFLAVDDDGVWSGRKHMVDLWRSHAAVLGLAVLSS